MSTYQIYVATFHVILERIRQGLPVEPQFVIDTDRRFRELRREFPNQAGQAALDPYVDEPPIDDPWEEIEVELSPTGIRRVIGPLSKLVEDRLATIHAIVSETLQQYSENVRNVVALLGDWMRNRTIVHVIGAGRALLAASLPANRLAHGGANVFILGDKAPPPNSRFGGGIIAASATGKTPSVLEIMTFARRVSKDLLLVDNKEIHIIGISDPNADKVEPYEPFPKLCTPGCFLGVRPASGVKLRGLADIEEYAISELLDALVVAAGLEIGVNFRLGHEDLVGGATGPHHQHRQI